MKSVWLVESGEYSDYRVNAIFETQAQAEEFTSHGGFDAPREWILNTWTPADISFVIEMDMQGNITKVDESPWVDEPDREEDFSTRWNQKTIRFHIQRGPRERAIKIASEMWSKVRVFLDQADEMMERAKYEKNGEYRFNDSLRVARILAGLEQPPNPPKCGNDHNVMTILGVS